MSAVEVLLDALRDHGSVVKASGARTHIAQCPSHPDRTPSLSVTQAASRVLLRCHAGCSVDDIVAALRLTTADLFDEPLPSSSTGDIVAVYDYVDAQGQLLYQVLRKCGKRFVQRRPDGTGGWAYNLDGVQRVPYRLPQVIEAVRAGEPAYVVEGEKDVDRLAALGVVATTNPGGAGKWRREYGDCLTGANVTVIADRDEPGYAPRPAGGRGPAGPGCVGAGCAVRDHRSQARRQRPPRRWLQPRRPGAGGAGKWRALATC